MSGPPSEDELNAHLVRDHQIVGWVFMTAAAFNFLPLFSPDFAVLLKVWPLVVMGLSLVVLFHTDPGTSALVNRQHAIMAFLFIITGLTWLAARFIPLLEPLKYSWPMLFGIVAYMFITHKQQDDHAHDQHDHDHGDDGHDHDHGGD